jgi:hypothetical protein
MWDNRLQLSPSFVLKMKTLSREMSLQFSANKANKAVAAK